MADGVTRGSTHARDCGQDADSRRDRFGGPGGTSVDGPDDDRAPEYAKAHCSAVGSRCARNAVEASDVGRYCLRVPCVPLIDGGENRVDPNRKAVRGARARRRAQATGTWWRRSRSPRQTARRCTHDGRASSQVARAPDGDAVLGCRARNPREIDGVCRWALEGPGRAIVGRADDVRGGAEVRSDGDTGRFDRTGDGIQL